MKNNKFNRMSGKLLFIQARNYGDAVISLELINSLCLTYTDLEVNILTTNPLKDIYKYINGIKSIYFVNFPFPASLKKKILNLKNIIQLYYTIRLLKKQKFNYILNCTGDYRENLIGKLIRPKYNISLKISKNHPVKKYIKYKYDFLTNHKIEIPNDIINIYDIYNQISVFFNLKRYKIDIGKIKSNKNNIIGIHPLSNENYKMWEWYKWIKLIEKLHEDKYKIYIFCAPHEEYFIQDIFSSVLNEDIKISAQDIHGFINKLSEVKLLVGLDSFAVHISYLLNINSIIINGPVDSEVWKTPLSHVISNSNICKYYPCKKKVCEGSDIEYQCIKTIEVYKVYDQIIKCIQNG